MKELLLSLATSGRILFDMASFVILITVQLAVYVSTGVSPVLPPEEEEDWSSTRLRRGPERFKENMIYSGLGEHLETI